MATQNLIPTITEMRFKILRLPHSPTFEPHKRAARKGRSPQTGAEITIAEATTPVFKAGKALKDAVK